MNTTCNSPTLNRVSILSTTDGRKYLSHPTRHGAHVKPPPSHELGHRHGQWNRLQLFFQVAQNHRAAGAEVIVQHRALIYVIWTAKQYV